MDFVLCCRKTFKSIKTSLDIMPVVALHVSSLPCFVRGYLWDYDVGCFMRFCDGS